jgi:UDP-N-acetylglucosamine acyltransferase
MENQVHPSAIISENNVLFGNDIIIGPHVIIEENVTIGDGTIIKANAYIGRDTTLGKNVKIFQGAVVGEAPQDLKYANEDTTTHVGDNTVIREYVTVHRGTTDRRKTVIGKNCLIMAYAHIAHDCIVGDQVIIANSCNLGGHVVIGSHVIIGGMVGIHQFCHIGDHAFVAGGFRISQDIPPYIRASKYPLAFNGLNAVGLRRRGMSTETIRDIKRAYKLIYRSTYNVREAVEILKQKDKNSPEVLNIIQFIQSSPRGIIRGK